jgi:hypothetical protein
MMIETMVQFLPVIVHLFEGQSGANLTNGVSYGPGQAGGMVLTFFLDLELFLEGTKFNQPSARWQLGILTEGAPNPSNHGDEGFSPTPGDDNILLFWNLVVKQITLILVWTPEQAKNKECKSMNMIIRTNKESRMCKPEEDPTAEKHAAPSTMEVKVHR